MFVRLVARGSERSEAININSILYIAEKESLSDENSKRSYLHIETSKGVYRIYFENETVRQRAFESILRKKGILNLEGVESTFFRENMKEYKKQ